MESFRSYFKSVYYLLLLKLFYITIYRFVSINKLTSNFIQKYFLKALKVIILMIFFFSVGEK
jgi:hypothetical protein